MTSALDPRGGNITPTRGWQPYTPALIGATDNPVVTYSTQQGQFLLDGSTCRFNFKLVSTTMTKTTLTDLVQITLPIAAATVAGAVTDLLCRLENATPVANMIVGEIASAGTALTLRNYTLAAGSSQCTYAVTTPGIGVLTNTITINGTGSYNY